MNGRSPATASTHAPTHAPDVDASPDHLDTLLVDEFQIGFHDSQDEIGSETAFFGVLESKVRKGDGSDCSEQSSW